MPLSKRRERRAGSSRSSLAIRAKLPSRFPRASASNRVTLASNARRVPAITAHPLPSSMMFSKSSNRSLVLFAIGIHLAVLSFGSSARAYAWMIRREYTGCNQCHADPSGGGLPTLYGRAQGELLLRTRYGPPGNEDMPPLGRFLFGAIGLPDALLLGGDVRTLYMVTQIKNAPSNGRFVFMQADLEGQVSGDRLRANASVGYADKGALAAAITHRPDQNLVSRIHWVGVEIGKERDWLLRAGRFNLPFGIRTVEHTLWVRSSTRTDINVAQQEGVALAYNGEGLRGELMLIAGNFQVSPAVYRERGYSGYVEYAPSTKLAFGASSLATHADLDIFVQTPLWRGAHGLFLRATPAKAVVLFSEADLLVKSEPPSAEAPAVTSIGYVGMAQGDLEIIQGIHLGGTLEVLAPPPSRTTPPSYGAWGSLSWFFAPHMDVRLDAITQSLPAGNNRLFVNYFLGQVHFFL